MHDTVIEIDSGTMRRTRTTTRRTNSPDTPASVSEREPDGYCRPEPLIDAWARRAMSANGFGDIGSQSKHRLMDDKPA